MAESSVTLLVPSICVLSASNNAKYSVSCMAYIIPMLSSASNAQRKAWNTRRVSVSVESDEAWRREGGTMRQRVVLVAAVLQCRPVAAAICKASIAAQRR